MGRRRKAVAKSVAPDSIYNSKVVSKFVNKLMMGGKKSLSEKIFYEALNIAEKKISKPGIDIFLQALSNSKPQVEVRSRRVGGATYQVPVDIRSVRQECLAMRWLIRFTRARTEKSTVERLSNELLDAYKNIGKTIKKREETHKMAEANKAFAHFKW